MTRREATRLEKEVCHCSCLIPTLPSQPIFLPPFPLSSSPASSSSILLYSSPLHFPNLSSRCRGKPMLMTISCAKLKAIISLPLLSSAKTAAFGLRVPPSLRSLAFLLLKPLTIAVFC